MDFPPPVGRIAKRGLLLIPDLTIPSCKLSPDFVVGVSRNESKSKYGVLRGLHYQLNTFAQTKLVRVIEGSVLDVAVDIRVGSPTFGKHVSVELNSKNKRQLFIPRGFAHGFIVLSKEAVFSYKVDNYYNPKYDRGILYNDPSLNVNWSILNKNIKLYEKFFIVTLSHPIKY